MTLRVRDLSKRFGNRWALRDVSLQAERGEIVGLVGGAGSGKTVLLEAIGGKYPINSGAIELKDNAVNRSSARMLSRDAGSESLLGSLLRRTRPGTTMPFADQLTVALTSKFDILLLDEPFAGLDRDAREQLADRIAAATQDIGLVTVIAAADFEHILLSCDRVEVLKDGYVEQSGTPREIYETPASRYVASLSGAVNLIEARRLTSSRSAVHEFQTIEGGHRLFAVNEALRVPGALNRNVFLAVRPEHISISFGASFPEDNLLRAVVAGHRFMGAKTIVFLDVDGMTLEAFVPRLVGLDIGEECMVGLPPDRIAILAE